MQQTELQLCETFRAVGRLQSSANFMGQAGGLVRRCEGWFRYRSVACSMTSWVIVFVTRRISGSKPELGGVDFGSSFQLCRKGLLGLRSNHLELCGKVGE